MPGMDMQDGAPPRILRGCGAIVDAVGVPVIAAGGIADGRTAAAAFMLGASAVQLGTAFMRCEEANMYDAHRAALAQADESCTLIHRPDQRPAGALHQKQAG